MVKIEEIIRLKGLGHSQRKVSKILGCARNTVKEYWEASREDLKKYQAQQEVCPGWLSLVDWEGLGEELSSSIPRTVLHEELSKAHPGKIPNYQNFCKQLNKKIAPPQALAISLARERIPGKSLEVDYSGDGIDILIPATGELKQAELFVAVLGFSSKIYAEFTWTQQLPDFINAHVNCFEYMGGTTEYIVADNCKTAVSKSDKEDPIINRSYLDLARHYNTAIDPADAYRPKHKAVVEKSVQIIQKGFLARVRNKTYTSLREVNRDLSSFVNELNDKTMPSRGLSRNELAEQENLTALPAHKYEFAQWQQLKVHPDCHIQLQRNYYSVPHQFVGKTVQVKFNAKMVSIYHNLDFLCSHPRTLEKRGRRITNKNHYPPRYQLDSHFLIQKSLADAKAIGPYAYAFTQRRLLAPRYPLKHLRSIQALLGLQNKYTPSQINHACSLAIRFDKISLPFIKDCLKNSKPKNTSSTLLPPTRQPELTCLQGGLFS